MNSYPNLQTLFSNVIQAVITKIALEYNLSVSEITNKIGNPTITDDLESSIQSYCNSLIPPAHVESIPEKPKKIVKKKVLSELAAPIIGDTIVSSNIETIIVPEKPKRVLKKKATVETVVAETIASVDTETIAPPVTETIAPPVTETNASVGTETNIVPNKPKKILKKKAPVITETIASPITETVAETIPSVVTESSIVSDKQKKVLKKKVPAKETVEKETPVISENSVMVDKPVPKVKDIVEPELEEIKLKPRKIMLKKPVFESKKNVEDPEYGEDVDQVDIYESLQTYEEDSLEPREINGTKYYVDTSGYIYDFENQDLVGKLNQSSDSIILLNDFSPISE